MILIRNATVLDPASGDLTENASVVVEGERIREVSRRTDQGLAPRSPSMPAGAP